MVLMNFSFHRRTTFSALVFLEHGLPAVRCIFQVGLCVCVFRATEGIGTLSVPCTGVDPSFPAQERPFLAFLRGRASSSAPNGPWKCVVVMERVPRLSGTRSRPQDGRMGATPTCPGRPHHVPLLNRGGPVQPDGSDPGKPGRLRRIGRFPWGPSVIAGIEGAVNTRAWFETREPTLKRLNQASEERCEATHRCWKSGTARWTENC